MILKSWKYIGLILQKKKFFTKNKINENAKLQTENYQGYSKKLKKVFCEGEKNMMKIIL